MSEKLKIITEIVEFSKHIAKQNGAPEVAKEISKIQPNDNDAFVKIFYLVSKKINDARTKLDQNDITPSHYEMFLNHMCNKMLALINKDVVLFISVFSNAQSAGYFNHTDNEIGRLSEVAIKWFRTIMFNVITKNDNFDNYATLFSTLNDCDLKNSLIDELTCKIVNLIVSQSNTEQIDKLTEWAKKTNLANINENQTDDGNRTLVVSTILANKNSEVLSINYTTKRSPGYTGNENINYKIVTHNMIATTPRYALTETNNNSTQKSESSPSTPSIIYALKKRKTRDSGMVDREESYTEKNAVQMPVTTTAATSQGAYVGLNYSF